MGLNAHWQTLVSTQRVITVSRVSNKCEYCAIVTTIHMDTNSKLSYKHKQVVSSIIISFERFYPHIQLGTSKPLTRFVSFSFKLWTPPLEFPQSKDSAVPRYSLRFNRSVVPTWFVNPKLDPRPETGPRPLTSILYGSCSFKDQGSASNTEGKNMGGGTYHVSWKVSVRWLSMNNAHTNMVRSFNQLINQSSSFMAE